MPSAALEIVLTILAALFWLVALAAHIILLKFLLTPYERIKLRLPAGSWPLLLSITIFDLVALLTALPFTTLYAIFDGWPFGELLCDLSTYVKVASLTMASYTILALLMQCYELIVKTSRPPLSTVKLGLLVGSLWLLALVTAIPMLYSHRVVYLDVHEAPVENMETFDFENRNYNLTQKMLEMKKESLLETVAASRPYCVPNHHLGFIFHSVMYLYLQFLIPTGIVIFLFIRITDTMNKAKSNKGNTLEIAQQHQPDVVQLPQNVKYVKSILILAVVFHLFWAPTNFFSLFIASNSVVWSYFEVLSEATYFIKPLILFAVNTNFQNALRTIGIPTTEVEDVDGYQVGFSKMEEAGVY